MEVEGQGDYRVEGLSAREGESAGKEIRSRGKRVVG